MILLILVHQLCSGSLSLFFSRGGERKELHESASYDLPGEPVISTPKSVGNWVLDVDIRWPDYDTSDQDRCLKIPTERVGRPTFVCQRFPAA